MADLSVTVPDSKGLGTVCFGQLGFLILAGWKITISLQVKGLVCWFGRWYVCWLHCGSKWLLAWATDGRISCCRITSSCQSASVCEIVKRMSLNHITSTYQVPDIYLHLLTLDDINSQGLVIVFQLCDIFQNVCTWHRGAFVWCIAVQHWISLLLC